MRLIAHVNAPRVPHQKVVSNSSVVVNGMVLPKPGGGQRDGRTQVNGWVFAFTRGMTSRFFGFDRHAFGIGVLVAARDPCAASVDSERVAVTRYTIPSHLFCACERRATGAEKHQTARDPCATSADSERVAVTMYYPFPLFLRRERRVTGTEKHQTAACRSRPIKGGRRETKGE